MNPESRNIVDLKSKHAIFSNPELKYTVSSRRIKPAYDAIDYLKVFYTFIKVEQIASVFGSTTDNSSFYGGRKYNPQNSLAPEHIQRLSDKDIGISLTFTNHYFSEENYNDNLLFLEKYHNEKNSVICVSDELAKQIRRDFPKYKLRASIIKNITSIKAVEDNLEYYDDIVIPMDLNDDDDFLISLPEKDRIMLFANANCAYTCPARTCYKGFSQINKGDVVKSNCSKGRISRLDLGNVYFDVEKLYQFGFRHFKLVPLAPPHADVAMNNLQALRKK